MWSATASDTHTISRTALSISDIWGGKLTVYVSNLENKLCMLSVDVLYVGGTLRTAITTMNVAGEFQWVDCYAENDEIVIKCDSDCFISYNFI